MFTFQFLFSFCYVNQFSLLRKLVFFVFKPLNHSFDAQKLADHFKSHFNPTDHFGPTPPELERDNLPLFLEELQNISRNIHIDDSPPTIDEIEHQLKVLKNNKASNDIAPDILKACNHPILNQVIHRMTLNLWNNLDIIRSRIKIKVLRET